MPPGAAPTEGFYGPQPPGALGSSAARAAGAPGSSAASPTPAQRQEPRRWTGIHADPFHSYCVALVVATHNELENWALQQGIKYNDFSDLCQKQEAVREVLGSFAKVCVLYSHR
jgi:hypothetical protein